MPEVRKGMPDVQLTRDEFVRRFRERFADPGFEPHTDALDRIADAAWDAYDNSRKAPHTRKAGPGYADPDYDLSVDWIEASRKIKEAEQRQKDPASPSRILLINGAARSEHTCPGEMSKTFRLATIARKIFDSERGHEIEYLDLSRLTSEYGRNIYPLQGLRLDRDAALPLAVLLLPEPFARPGADWMNDIYPMWAAAHGVMILCPVNWYQTPSVLKLMIDRLVCADGGNPDPTSTQGKEAALAKEIELKGWHYPRHLAGRVFSVVVHGDSVGAETVQDALTAWLTDMGLIGAGHLSQIGRYIGYMEAYATSHDALDKDDPVQEETRNAARSLVEAVKLMRQGELKQPDAKLREARPK